jgi:hypothetical protein
MIPNSFEAMAPLTGPENGVFFKGAYFPQKLPQRVLLRDSTTPFKGMCLFIYLKEVKIAL